MMVGKGEFMARIKLEKCDSPLFSTVWDVTISQINYGNHMGNDSFLSMAHEARMRFFASHNMNEMSLFGCALIMSDAAVMYRSEVRWGEKLKIELMIKDIQEYGFDFIYGISSVADQREIARIKTGMNFFDYQQKKLYRADESFLNKLRQIAQS